MQAAVADRVAATGDAGEGVSDECMALAVAARSTRRDGVAAWRWRYPGSPRDHLASVLAFFPKDRRPVEADEQYVDLIRTRMRTCLANVLILEKPSQPATQPAVFTTPCATEVATTVQIVDGTP
jgi:hypothetical protein